jgi:hypothetical protein
MEVQSAKEDSSEAKEKGGSQEESGQGATHSRRGGRVFGGSCDGFES